MPYNKGDFTQQGVAGHVNANLRLNEKRLVNIDLTSDEEAEGCTIIGAVTDLLNNEVYPIGAGVSGNIEITENGENINVAPYATATVNVSGGGGGMPGCAITIVNDDEESHNWQGWNSYFQYQETSISPNNSATFYYGAVDLDTDVWCAATNFSGTFFFIDSTGTITDAINCVLYDTGESTYAVQITDPTIPASCTVLYSDIVK